MRTALVIVGMMAASEARADEVDDLFTKGQKAFEERRFADAEAHWEKAFALRQSADLAANLAQAELEIGQQREAANHLAYALRFLPATAPADVRAEMQAALDKTQSTLGRVRVTVNVDGATVRVGGVVVGTSPLPDPIFVDPGRVEVQASLAGHRDAKESVQTVAKEVSPVDLKLELAAKPEEDRPLWPGVVLAVGSAAFIGAGVGLTIAAKEALGPAEVATCEEGPETCAPAVVDAIDEHNLLLPLGITGFALGGAAALGAVLYFAIPAASTDGAAVVLRPAVGPSVVGLSLELGL